MGLRQPQSKLLGTPGPAYRFLSVLPLRGLSAFYTTHRDLTEDIDEQVQNGEQELDPVATKPLPQVSGQRHYLKNVRGSPREAEGSQSAGGHAETQPSSLRCSTRTLLRRGASGRREGDTAVFKKLGI